MSTGMDLKVRRIRARVTQIEFAKHAGRSRSWVSRVERDDFHDPRVVERYLASLVTFENVSDVA